MSCETVVCAFRNRRRVVRAPDYVATRALIGPNSKLDHQHRTQMPTVHGHSFGVTVVFD